jgi:hypothetical protein
VVDTSTLVSGAVSPPTSPPAVLLDAAQAAVFDLIACPRIRVIVAGDADLLDHDGLEPPAIHARAACELLGLL